MTEANSHVFIVDDDPAIRESLGSLLRSVGHCVLPFESTEAFLEGEHPDLPSCLVLDVRLRGRSGLDLQRELARRGIEVPVVFITGHGDVAMSVTAMKAGAIEFLTKPFRDQELLDAVCRGIEIDRERRRHAVDFAELAARFEALTAREREVMQLVTSGLLNKQVAAQLGLSEMTVKVHRANAMRKMEAASLPELVRLADRLKSPGFKA